MWPQEVAGDTWTIKPTTSLSNCCDVQRQCGLQPSAHTLGHLTGFFKIYLIHLIVHSFQKHLNSLNIVFWCCITKSWFSLQVLSMANVPSVGPLYHIAYSDLIRSRISWMVLSPESKDTGLEYFTKKIFNFSEAKCNMHVWSFYIDVCVCM